MNIRKVIFYMLSVALALGLAAFSVDYETGINTDHANELIAQLPLSDDLNIDVVESIDESDLESTVIHAVPFTPQTPFGNWADDRQSYACEEASVLMAVSWARGESFSLIDAERIIVEISDYEFSKYGEFRDTSTADTLDRIVNEYFGYEQAYLVEETTIDEIKQQLHLGNVLLVPVHGQELNNPFFTPPGPVEHMIVIVGYDSETKEFITHDPGTKNGEGIRYSQEILYDALRDYDSGYQEVINVLRKPMIVIEKQKA